MKVSPTASRKMRTLPEGVDQRSTIRHPDFLGADDLAVKIEELRIATNYQVPIFIKMGATRPRFDVAIAAKAGADVIVVDGAEGGTGASPELLLNHTGIPTMSAIRAAREALDECGMTGKVDLVAAGGIRSGVDAAKCLALGRRRGDGRQWRDDRAWDATRRAIRRIIAKLGHVARRLPPLPHRPMPGRHRHAGT